MESLQGKDVRSYRFSFDGESDLEVELEEVWGNLLVATLETGQEHTLSQIERTMQFYMERSKSTGKGDGASLAYLTTATNLYWATTRMRNGKQLTGITPI